jgi:glucose dehydrogenase
MLAGMAGLHGLGWTDPVVWQVTPDRLGVLVLGVALVYAMPWLKRQGGGPLRWLLIPLFLWALATLSAQAFTPFLYFQF